MKQCVLVPDPCLLDLLTGFKQMGLLVQFCWSLVMVAEGRSSLLVFLKSVSVAMLRGKNPKSFCLSFSVRQFHFLCALISTARCRTVLYGTNTVLLSLKKAARCHICAVPRAFISLGKCVRSCPVSCGHLPKQDLWRAVPCFLFEGFQCV